MLMCSAPVYHDVIDEWKHAGRPGRRKKKEKKLGELPSYLQGMHGPDKSRSEDLSGVRLADADTCCVPLPAPPHRTSPHHCRLMHSVACSLPLRARSCLRRARLAGGVEQRQVVCACFEYAPGCISSQCSGRKMGNMTSDGASFADTWGSRRRFLPELQDSHGSQVLLPFVKSSERKRKTKAADDSRAAMLSKSLDQSVIQPSTQSGETGDASAAAKRPPSATAQAILEKERAHSARPKSAKSVNMEALEIKEKHAIEVAKAAGQGATRPQSREGVRPTSRGPPSRAEARPPSQANDARPPSSSALTSGSKADAASPLAKSATTRDLAGSTPLARSATRKDLAGPAALTRAGTKKDLGGAPNDRKGGRGRKGAPAAADAAAPGQSTS